jgi:hypothetical protein
MNECCKHLSMLTYTPSMRLFVIRLHSSGHDSCICTSYRARTLHIKINTNTMKKNETKKIQKFEKNILLTKANPPAHPLLCRALPLLRNLRPI